MLLQQKQINASFAGSQAASEFAGLIVNGNFDTLNVASGVWTKFNLTSTLDPFSSSKWDMPANNRLRWIDSASANCRFSWSGNFYKTAAGSRVGQIALVKNGNSLIRYGITQMIFQTSTSFNNFFFGFSSIVSMSLNDYVELWFIKTGGGLETIRCTGFSNTMFLWGEKYQ